MDHIGQNECPILNCAGVNLHWMPKKCFCDCKWLLTHCTCDGNSPACKVKRWEGLRVGSACDGSGFQGYGFVFDSAAPLQHIISLWYLSFLSPFSFWSKVWGKNTISSNGSCFLSPTLVSGKNDMSSGLKSATWNYNLGPKTLFLTWLDVTLSHGYTFSVFNGPFFLGDMETSFETN